MDAYDYTSDQWRIEQHGLTDFIIGVLECLSMRNIMNLSHFPITWGTSFILLFQLRFANLYRLIVNAFFFRLTPEIITDELFQSRLYQCMEEWKEVRKHGLNILLWWKLLVKPGVLKLG